LACTSTYRQRGKLGCMVKPSMLAAACLPVWLPAVAAAQSDVL
jgi:hypothetical protein